MNEEKIKATALRRARKGARWLDRLVPDWARSIDLRRLNLGSTCYCTLGQLEAKRLLPGDDPFTEGPARNEVTCYDPYSDALDRLNLGHRQRVMFGFDVTKDDVEFDYLTDAWSGEVKVRR